MTVEVFHIVAKDPQKQHVPKNVRDAGMKKHARYERNERDLERRMARESSREAGWDRGVGHDEHLKGACGERELIDEHRNVSENQCRVNNREGSARIQVFERNEHASACRVAKEKKIANTCLRRVR